MKKCTRILLGALLLLGIAGTAGQGAATKAEQEIRTLEQRMNEAYAKNDLQTYFNFYAQDFTQWLPEGRTDLETYKRQWMAYVSAGNSVQAAEVRELLLRVAPSEDAAVASYILYVKTKAADGKITEEESQETDVWFKRDGAWKVVALHFAPLAKKP
jgi:ketosteroid isomerase-like protein